MARSFYADSKRVSNARLKQELGVRLHYPSYREGLAEIARDLRSKPQSPCTRQIRGVEMGVSPTDGACCASSSSWVWTLICAGYFDGARGVTGVSADCYGSDGDAVGAFGEAEDRLAQQARLPGVDRR